MHHREILSTRVNAGAPEDENLFHDVVNLCVSLLNTSKYTEVPPLLRQYLPTARRVMGRDHTLTFTMTESLAQSLFRNGDAPRADMLEAAEMLTEHSRRLRQVLGSAHPVTQRNEQNLKCIREHIARLE